jgi:hypothetical protein
MISDINPYKIRVSEEKIDALKHKLSLTTFPDGKPNVLAAFHAVE